MGSPAPITKESIAVKADGALGMFRAAIMTLEEINNFICSECGTKYSSPSKEPPPGIKWDDGHVCTPIPVKDEPFDINN